MKSERHAEAHFHRDVRLAVEAPAEPADQVDDRVEQRHRAPGGRQHVDRVERAAEEGQRRHDQHRDELHLLPVLRPDADDESEQAEGDGRQQHERDHPERVQDRDRHEERGRREDDEAQHHRFRGGGADVAEHDLEGRDRRGQDLEDRARELREVDAERRIRDALGEERQHDEARHDEGAVADATDLRHARADRRAEHDHEERRRDDRRQHALQDRAQESRHLEAVDGPDAVAIECRHAHCRAPRPTRLTKISSSELSRVLRSR